MKVNRYVTPAVKVTFCVKMVVAPLAVATPPEMLTPEPAVQPVLAAKVGLVTISGFEAGHRPTMRGTAKSPLVNVAAAVVTVVVPTAERVATGYLPPVTVIGIYAALRATLNPHMLKLHQMR